MKFIKSNLARKLIVILIALMIFNIAIPKEVKAWDIGGILFKPVASMILSILVTVDTTIGLVLNGGASIGMTAIRWNYRSVYSRK